MKNCYLSERSVETGNRWLTSRLEQDKAQQDLGQRADLDHVTHSMSRRTCYMIWISHKTFALRLSENLTTKRVVADTYVRGVQAFRGIRKWDSRLAEAAGQLLAAKENKGCQKEFMGE